MINEMLELASKQDIKPWVTKRPLEDANQAVVDMHNVSSSSGFLHAAIADSFFLPACSRRPAVSPIYVRFLPGSCRFTNLASTSADRYVLVNQKNGGKL